MTSVKVYNLSGKEVETLELNPEFFGLPVNEELVLQALHVLRTNSREALAHTKTRTNVRGGGKKPWKQKGTGRARAGSIRSPLWIGGGIIFGPLKERNYSLNINKKMKRKALLMALSDKIASAQVIIVDELNLSAPKTKVMLDAMKNLKIEGGSVLMGMAKKTEAVSRASANIQKFILTQADSLNIEDVLGAKYLVLDKASLPVIEKTFNYR